MDTCMCMAESLHCSPETTPTLLIGHTLKENKKFFFFLKEQSITFYFSIWTPVVTHYQYHVNDYLLIVIEILQILQTGSNSAP